jgi:transcriptional regulator GlxA family with amidase domain
VAQLIRMRRARVSETMRVPPHRAHSGTRGVDESGRHPDADLIRRLLRAKDRMDAASHEHWPVRRLARISHVSAAHFARSFRDAFGVPPHRYLLTRRIERATALLRETDLPIIEVAMQTGWASLGTFGRTFRDVVGVSPGEWRARERALPSPPSPVPGCYLSAAARPALTIAVSEKRRQQPTRTLPAPAAEDHA